MEASDRVKTTNWIWQVIKHSHLESRNRFHSPRVRSTVAYFLERPEAVAFGTINSKQRPDAAHHDAFVLGDFGSCSEMVPSLPVALHYLWFFNAVNTSATVELVISGRDYLTFTQVVMFLNNKLTKQLEQTIGPMLPCMFLNGGLSASLALNSY